MMRGTRLRRLHQALNGTWKPRGEPAPWFWLYKNGLIEQREPKKGVFTMAPDIFATDKGRAAYVKACAEHEAKGTLVQALTPWAAK